jgi:N6-L-threonylcarbamoyladenine synthase
MIVLGIETSCDETALAIYDTNVGLLGHLLHTQTNQLIKHGGVFPEVAARYHIQYLSPLLNQLLFNTNLTLQDLNFIAYTKGPGLVGSLLTGISFAKTLSFALKIPSLGVNHLEGHLLSCFIKEANSKNLISQPKFPFLVLLASGGHTMLIKANSLGNYQILGETLDDAAGEALDKTAKLLGINPPNGKELSNLAAKSHNSKLVDFPRPLVNQKNLNFSFSGLKTAAMLKIKQLAPSDEIDKADLAASFQEAVMDTLAIRCRQALESTKLNQLVIAGGVSANLCLRNKLLALENIKINNFGIPIKIFFPKLEFCTDNAAMIALAGGMRAAIGLQDNNLDITALARWDL